MNETTLALEGILAEARTRLAAAGDARDFTEYQRWLDRCDALEDLLNTGEVQPDLQEALDASDRTWLAAQLRVVGLSRSQVTTP